MYYRSRTCKFSVEYIKYRYLCYGGRMQSGPTPYHWRHAEFKNRIVSDLHFNKWKDKPNRAKALYWRLHPEEQC